MRWLRIIRNSGLAYGSQTVAAGSYSVSQLSGSAEYFLFGGDGWCYCVVQTASTTYAPLIFGAIEYQKDSDRESGEPEKGAVTDALKRCARLFGIGRYLLDDPPKVNGGNDAEFNKWLVAKQKAWAEANAPKTETVPPPPPVIVPKPEPTPEPKRVTVTTENDLNAVFSDGWADALNEAETLHATEAQKQETNGKTFYHLIDSDKGISATLHRAGVCDAWRRNSMTMRAVAFSSSLGVGAVAHGDSVTKGETGAA